MRTPRKGSLRVFKVDRPIAAESEWRARITGARRSAQGYLTRPRLTFVYKHYVLAILLFAFAFNFLDRQVMSVAMESIKTELALSDTQLGLLTGMGFAVFYSIVGIPIARWADRGSRSMIISMSLCLLSVTVALCSTVGNFLQLMLMRVGAGAGEAGVVPAAHSLLASYFDRSARLRAMSIFLLGGPLSLVAGYSMGGWLTELFGWRLAFLASAGPGLILALLVRFTVRDPRDASVEVSEVSDLRNRPLLTTKTPARQVIRVLWRQRSFRHLLFAYTGDSLFGFGLFQWLPVFFIRNHEMSTGQVGTWMAISWGFGAALGTFAGGCITSRATVNAERRQLRIMSLSAASYVPITVVMLLSSDKQLALGLMFFGALVYAVSNAPSFSLIQGLAPEHMRATAVASAFLLGNLIGQGLGPLMVGSMSDGVAHAFGINSLRVALLAMAPGYLWVAAHYYKASRTVMTDLSDVEREQTGRVTSAA